MEKAPLLSPSLDVKRLSSALLLVLSTVASACKEVVYVPSYQNLPEDTGYSHADEPEDEVPQGDLDEDEPNSSDSGVLDFPLSAEECGETFLEVGEVIYDWTHFLVITDLDYSLSPIVSIRYEEKGGAIIPAETLMPLVATANFNISSHTDYCYAMHWENLDLSGSIVMTFDLSCGIPLENMKAGRTSVVHLPFANDLCRTRQISDLIVWNFYDGTFQPDWQP